MSRPPLKIDAQLEASLRRMGAALEQSRHRLEAAFEPLGREAGTAAGRVAARTEEAASRIVDRQGAREQRREQWRERRRERQRERELGDEADLPKGIVFAVVAITCLLFALLRPQFFWMLFVALGFGTSAAQLFGRAARRRRLEREGQPAGESEDVPEPQAAEAADQYEAPPAPPQAEPPDPKVARIQALCDKLLAELEAGPSIVREVVTEPQTTIAGLRQACLETARRERELRAVLASQDEAALVVERDTLASRLAKEHDAIVRDRLGQALAALEQQLVHRAALATAATRLEAENTRILYTLENVHMQLLRARSTDIGAPELGGKLRDSLRELGTQIEAVAEALEFADAPVSPGSPPSSQPPQTLSVPDANAASPGAERAEKADREAAARRAAGARQAHRQ